VIIIRSTDLIIKDINDIKNVRIKRIKEYNTKICTTDSKYVLGEYNLFERRMLRYEKHITYLKFELIQAALSEQQ